jgi:hypothetical protein
MYVRVARLQQKRQEYVEATHAYQRACVYGRDLPERANAIQRESIEMVDQLLPAWKGTVQARIAQDPAVRGLAEKYPLVFLHSRRLVIFGGYNRCCYSFVYETSDPNKHYNDVQLLFDNGQGRQAFQINMVTNQKNTLTDLGVVDFAGDPNIEIRDSDIVDRTEHKAVEGHVYLEKVEDTRGNQFSVLFKVIAVDKESRYVAFIWRRLPGGKVVRRP